MPKLSIIIPFNNGKKYLEECLENLKYLEFEDYEIILIDDFSEDDSEKIAKKFKKVRYFYTKEKTLGVGNARNLGIKKACGKYIMFLDIDDTIENDLLKKLDNYMNQNIEMIKYKMKIIGDEKNYSKIIYEKGPSFCEKKGEEAFNQLCFKDNYLDSPCLYLINKEIFQRTGIFFEKNVYHEDFGLIPLLILCAKSFVSTDIYGYNYFQSSNSIMRNNEYNKSVKKVCDKFFLYEKSKQIINKMNLKSQTKLNILEYYTNSIIVGIKELEKKEAKIFKKKIIEKGLVKNLRVRNIKQLIKKYLFIFYILGNPMKLLK